MNNLERIDPIKLGDRLRIARSKSGKRQELIATLIGVSRTTLVALEQGERRIRLEELRKLAEVYQTSINELVRDSAIHVDLVGRFRRASADEDQDPSLEAVKLLNRLASATSELENTLGRIRQFHYPPERPLLPGDLEIQAEDAGLELRHRLGLGLAPIADIGSLVELELGVRIFFRPIHSSISGVFAFDPAIGACMLINSNHPPERQAQSVAHETGHFLTSRGSLAVTEASVFGTSREEKFCGLFALSFLLPAAGVRRRFQDICSTENRFSARHLLLLAHSFNVSIEAISRRLEMLKLLPMGTFDSLKERGFAIESAKKAMGFSSPSPNLNPPRLILLAVEAHQQGIFSESQLCGMLAMSRSEFRRHLDVFGSSALDDEITLKT